MFASMLLAGAAGVLMEAVVTHRADELAGHLEPLAQANASVLQDMTNAETGVRGYQLTGQRQFLQPYEQGLASYPAELEKARVLAGDDAPLQKLISAEAVAAQRWLVSFGRPAANWPLASPALLPETEGKALFGAVRQANGAVAQRVEHEITAARAATHRDERTVTLVLAGLFAANVVAGTALGFRVVRNVVLPLERVASALRTMTSGHDGVRVDEAGTVETRELARAVNALALESERRARAEQQRARFRELHVGLMRNFNEHLDIGRLVRQAVEVLGVALEADRVLLRLRPRTVPGEPRQLDVSATIPAVPGEIVGEWNVPGLVPTTQLGATPVALLAALASFPSDGRCHDASRAVAAAASEDQAVAAHLSALGVISYLVCPLMLDGALVGRISLISGRPEGTWDEDTMYLAEQAAADLARAVGHAHLYEEQRQMVAELEAADQAKAFWVSNVSHELRTPLTSVRGYLEMVRDGEAGELPDEAATMLGAVDRNAARLQGLIENLLTLSKVGAGTFQVKKSRVDVEDLARSVVSDMAGAAARSGVALGLVDSAQGAAVLGDTDALSRALVNLVANAVKFSPPGGRVTLVVGSTGGEVSLSVVDTGMGIPEDELAHIGERFFRASNAQAAVVPGTGLGLSIVRAVVDALDGRFSLTSTEGAGTTACITLPVYAGEPAGLTLAGGNRAE